MADEIIALHGGSLELQSQVGEGTTVTVTLPTCAALEADPERVGTPEIQKIVLERKQKEHEKRE